MVSLLFVLIMSFGFAAVAFGYERADDEMVLGEYDEYLAALDEYLTEDGELLAELDYEAIEVMSTNFYDWRRINNFYYLYINNQRFRNGWRPVGGHWYYLDSRLNGRMRTGWFTDTDGQRYFLNPRSGQGHVSHPPEGAMRIGWVYYRTNWFYLNSNTGGGGLPQGAMRSGALTLPDGAFFLNPLATNNAHRRELPGGAMRTGMVAIHGFRTTAAGNTINNQGLINEYRTCGRLLRAVNQPAVHQSLWYPRAAWFTYELTYAILTNDFAWRQSIMGGALLWEASSVPVRFTPHVGSPNVVLVALGVNGSDLGSTTMIRRVSPLTNEAVVTSFEIWLYSDLIDQHVERNPGFTRNNVAVSTMGHEIGHVLGLRDNPTNVGSASIMSTTRNRNTLLGPTNIDISNANLLNN